MLRPCAIFELLRGRGDATPDGPLEHLRHPPVSLEGRDRGQIGVAGGRGELLDRPLLDRVLAERREHLLDVADERRARAEHQDAAAREVGEREQQPGGAVQADGGLAGAGTALHHERAVVRSGDDVVLVGRDRRDDLPHLADPLRIDVAEDRLGQGVLRRARELLVDEPGDALLVDVEAASPDDAHRRARTRLVEGAGRRGAPVDDERLAVGVGEEMASDVERVAAAVVHVEAAEVERAAGVRVRTQPLGAKGLQGCLGELVDAGSRAPAEDLDRLGVCAERALEPTLLGLELARGRLLSSPDVGIRGWNVARHGVRKD